MRRYQCDLISGLLPAEEADSSLVPLSAILSAWRRCSTAVLRRGVCGSGGPRRSVVGAPDAAVLNQQGLPAAWLDAREFLALNALRNRRLMKGFLTRCCKATGTTSRQTSGGDRVYQP